MGVEALHLEPESDSPGHVRALTGGGGADAVLITASTRDDSLISQCAAMCRKRGRIVLTGVVGLNLKRADFYEKELTFQVSCSYGPGRYDPDYEERGMDYPRAFVRWTAARNFEAVLELMRDGRLSTANLVTDRAPFNRVADVYDRLSDAGAIGILIEYSEMVDDRRSVANQVECRRPKASVKDGAIAVIGAGQFTQGRILPSLARAGANVRIIASARGVSAAIASRRFRIPVATTDVDSVLRDNRIAAVVISTPHDQHASLVNQALLAGKHVFVEKPLCLTEGELALIASTRREVALRDGATPAVVVGFNRRHAPLALRMRQSMSTRTAPAFVTYTCNAGALPPDHWVYDPRVGGGRIIGEACHFIDFIQFLVGGRIVSVNAAKSRPGTGDLEDNVAITLGFADGSLGQVNYFACGNRAFPKERCEAAFDGKCLTLDNFRRLTGYGIGVSARNFRQDKGHDAQFAAFARLVAGVEPSKGFPVAFETVEDVMLATFLAVRSMREK
jgi:predicted dehydrogenase